jgi:hypothetical protein
MCNVNFCCKSLILCTRCRISEPPFLSNICIWDQRSIDNVFTLQSSRRRSSIGLHRYLRLPPISSNSRLSGLCRRNVVGCKQNYGLVLLDNRWKVYLHYKFCLISNQISLLKKISYNFLMKKNLFTFSKFINFMICWSRNFVFCFW